MKCKDCSCAWKGFWSSKPDSYICIGVPEPFEIRDINNECTEYEYNRDPNKSLGSNTPRLIDANVFRNEWLENGENEYVYDTNSVLDSIDCQPTIYAEPVRHGETSTFITTDDINKYCTRIIINEGEKSKWCRVFYEDDRSHGRWVNPHMNKCGHPCHHCSECGFLASQKDRNYCPNCGAKMDLEE